MTYTEWINSHRFKHQNIMQKLEGVCKEKIIEYFDYANMKENEKDFCPLYALGTKCHSMETLNCYLCACPYFRVGTKKSYCSIDRLDIYFEDDRGYLHLDCTECQIPHKKNFIKKIFDRDWGKIMGKVIDE